MYIEKKHLPNTINYQKGNKVLSKNMIGTKSEPFCQQHPYSVTENLPQSKVLKSQKGKETRDIPNYILKTQ